MPRKKPKRFTVTLSRNAYQRLKTIAEKQEPPLTLQYLVGYAVNDLLAKAERPRFVSKLGLPK
jgi:hypothetical protein